MSRHLCGHCNALTPTTATPNDVEGYFVSDRNVEAVLGHYDRPIAEPLEQFLQRKGARAGRCPECGLVTLFPAESHH